MFNVIQELMAESSLSLGAVAGAIFGTWVLYWIGLGFYRVYLSPLAKFPGPKLAAFSTAYQAYYDIWLHGQFFKHVDYLHEKYGPVVRINPHEVHINDPTFIDEVYAGNNKKRDKYKWQGRAVLLPDSLVATEPHDLHRKRRAAVNPYFSKANIRKLDPVVQKSVESIIERLDESGNPGAKPFHASLAFKAATCDIITYFCFGESTNYMQKKDYELSYFEAVDDHLHMGYKMTYISWLGPVMDKIPPAVMGWVYPGLKHLWAMHSRWLGQIEKIRTQDKGGDSTIFHGLLNSDLPASEKSNVRMRQEAQLLVLAGQDTTAYTLSSLMYRILADPSVFNKLKQELKTALPDPNQPLNSAHLEQLPYLTGIIQEGIRLHPGALVRQSRVATEQDLVYPHPNGKKSWVIPAGTPIAMDARSCNLNPKFFSDPHAFIPERWIENPRLDRYMLSFSKGTRICLGMNLAYSELYLILAGIFRRYELDDGTGNQKGPTLSLHETTFERDVDVKYDCLVPFPTKGSMGVQVKVRHGTGMST